jgi:hypothetical protein
MIMNYLFTFLLVLAGFSANAQYSGLPITLSLPNDQDTIEEKEPTFVWQCNTAALQTDPRLEQQIVVVELLEEQTATEAIAINTPVFIRGQLQTGSIAYSGTDHPLEEGKTYAWQVSYLFNSLLIQQSEVWVFTLAKPEPVQHQYLALRSQADGSVYRTSKPVLYLKISESGQLSLKGTIRSSDGIQKAVTLTPEGSEEASADAFLSTGELLCKVDFEDLDLPEGSYVFSWKAPGGKSYKLQFAFEK